MGPKFSSLINSIKAYLVKNFFYSVLLLFPILQILLFIRCKLQVSLFLRHCYYQIGVEQLFEINLLILFVIEEWLQQVRNKIEEMISNKIHPAITDLQVKESAVGLKQTKKLPPLKVTDKRLSKQIVQNLEVIPLGQSDLANRPNILINENKSRKIIKSKNQKNTEQVEQQASKNGQSVFQNTACNLKYQKENTAIRQKLSLQNKKISLAKIYRNKFMVSTNQVSFDFGEMSMTWKKESTVFMSSKFTLITNSINNQKIQNHGYLVSNFNGSLYNLYEPAKNIQKQNSDEWEKKKVLCTILFKKSPFSMKCGSVKQLVVYIRKQESVQLKKQYNSSGEPYNLQQIYQLNKNNITVLKSKEAKWSEKKQKHTLNFGGYFKVQSVNNFILEEQSISKQVLIMTKQQKDIYNMAVINPLSLKIASAIAVSNLDFKYNSQ